MDVFGTLESSGTKCFYEGTYYANYVSGKVRRESLDDELRVCLYTFNLFVFELLVLLP